MYIIVIGAGKVGWNLARELLEKNHEVTVIESNRRRYLTVEQELEHNVTYGDASELWVLERAGIQRADMGPVHRGCAQVARLGGAPACEEVDELLLGGIHVAHLLLRHLLPQLMGRLSGPESLQLGLLSTSSTACHRSVPLEVP